MRRIEFTADALYEQGGPGKGHTFRKGEVHDFTDDFAERWVRRKVARYLDTAEAPFKPLPESAAKKARRDHASRKQRAAGAT